MEQTRHPRLRRWAGILFHPRRTPALPTPTDRLTIPPSPGVGPVMKARPVPVVPTCDICTDPESAERPLKSVCRACRSSYCPNCVRELFIRAIKSPSDMPAKCCEMIPLHAAAKLLSKDEAAQYRAKFEEWKTDAKDRVYCPKKTCSVFIPLKAMKLGAQAPDGDANANAKREKEKRDSKDPAVPALDTQIDTVTPSIACPQCTTAICIVCKDLAHPMEPCKTETQNDEMLALLVKWGYKRCPRCGHGTRRMFGCSHMQCLCGAHWCWGCERSFLECDREGGCDWDEYDDDEASEDESEDENEAIGLAGPAGEALVNPDVVMTDVGAEGESTGAVAGEESAQVTDALIPRPPTPVVSAQTAEPEEPEEPRRRRNGNLDGGGDRYWQNQALNFGDEPGDADDSVWGCGHDWRTLAEMNAEAVVWDDEGVECHECWDEVRDKEKGWWCTRCGLLSCGKCNGKAEEKVDAEGSSSSS